MTIHKFDNGSILATGDNIYDFLFANKRNGYKRRCDFCRHNNTDICESCSRQDGERSCSCHINPPCEFCEKDAFEVTDYLINFKNYFPRRKEGFDWETFPSNKEVFDKYAKIENGGYVLSAEILSTGEIAIYLDRDLDEENEHALLEICKKHDFKSVAEKMIMNFTRLSGQK
jgi:hypothetical protein